MSNKVVSFSNRQALLAQLKKNSDQQWDVVVIGGGIIGAGILREACRKGLKVLLIEQQDFAWGTSSRSSKMVHGGLRYIAQGDIKLTKHSLQERERLLSEAPGLINRMGYYFLIHKGQFPGRFIMAALLSIYDCLAGIKDHRFFNKRAVINTFNGIEQHKLTGGSYYTDTVVDDARLVLRVLQESIAVGGQVLNYAKAVKLLKDDNKQVTGLMITDTANNSDESSMEKVEKVEQIELKAAVIINATGAWADKLRSEVINETRIRPLRGSHLLFSQQKLPISAALTLLHPEDNRPVFIFPWEGVTIVGTTDLDHDENLAIEASITNQEVDYLLIVINKYFPRSNIKRADVLSSYAGVRPVITKGITKENTKDNTFNREAKKSPSKERREHAIWANKGLITASGGKLTTFRLTAIDALNAAMPWLKDKIKLKPQDYSDKIFNTPKVSDLSLSKTLLRGVSDDWQQRMLGRYGTNAKHLLLETNDKELALIASTQFCLAECRWAVKHEAVIHLDDLLLRRTRLGLLLKNGAEQLLPQLAIICQQELGWHEQKWQDEVTRYQAIWKKHYSLPAQ